MTELYLNGEKVVLPADFNLGINMLNPLFNDTGTFSYPVGIPYKPNKEVLGYPARINNKTGSFSYDFRLIVDGLLLISGEAISNKDMGEDDFPLTLRSGSTVFKKWAEKNILNECDWGVDSWDSKDDFVDWLNKKIKEDAESEYDLITPPLFDYDYVDLSIKKDKYVNFFDHQTGSFLHEDPDQVTADVTFSYCYYLKWVLTKIAEMQGLEVTRNDISDIPDGEKIFMYSMNTCIPFIDESGGPYILKRNFFFPARSIQEFLDVVKNMFGISLIVNERNNTAQIIWKSKVVSETDKKTITHRVFPDGLTHFTSNGIVVKYSSVDELLSQEIPEEAVWDSVDDLEDVDFDAYPSTKPVVYETSTDMYYRHINPHGNDEEDPYWVPVSMYKPNRTGEEDADISISGVIMPTRQQPYEISISDGSVKMEIPRFDGKLKYVEQWREAIDDFVMDQDKDFDFAFGLFRGMIETESGSEEFYPISNTDIYRITGEKLGNLSFRLFGTDSLYDEVLKVEAEWITNRKKRRFLIPFSVREIVALSWTKKINIQGQDYLINDLRFDVTTKGISIVDMECFTA